MAMHVEKERGEDFRTYIQRKTALVAYVEGLKDALAIVEDVEEKYGTSAAEIRHRIRIMES